MKIIKPSVEIMYPDSYKNMVSLIEVAGRTCYKSEDKITDTSAENFLRNIIARGHEAVLEHSRITLRFVCDRGVSHEIVRHRLASYCQESTRYCNYSKEKFGNDVAFVEPYWFGDNSREADRRVWTIAMSRAEMAYFDMIDNGSTPQDARAVLPNSLKTEVVMTANVREWRHFFKLRCSKAAHPDMQLIVRKAICVVHAAYPVLFEDIYKEVFGDAD